MFKYLCIFLFFFLVCFKVQAFDYSNLEVEYFHVSQWEISNNIGKTVIGDILYDESNNLILATSDGVKRFDGASFSDYFSYDSNPNNVSFGKIYLNEGEIWATDSYGVFFLNKTGIKKHELPSNYNNYSSLALLNETEVWFISDFTLYSIGKNESSPLQVNSIKSTSVYMPKESSQIYLGSKGFVYELSPNGKVVNKIPLSHEDLVVISLYLTKEKLLLINTNKGTFVFNTKTNKMESEKIQVAARMVFEDSNGYLWFGTNKGIFIYKNKTLKHINLPHYQDLRIRGIVEDKYNNIWFGTWSEGLFRLKNTPFDFIKSNISANSYLETEDNAKWIGGYNGLSIMHQGVRISPNIADVESVAVYDIAKGLGGGVWVAYKTDLVLFGALGKNPRIINDIDALFYKFLLRDAENNLWVGTEKGLFYKNLDEMGYFKKLELPNNESISTILLLKNNEILMVTDKNAYVFQQGKFIQNTITKNLQPTNLVLAYDSVQDAIWYYDSKKNQLIKANNKGIQSFTLDKLLTQFSFYNIVVTMTNDVMLIGENGIVRVREEWWKNYTGKQSLLFEILAIPGLNQNECNGGHGSISKNLSGKLIFTCKNGILIFDAKEKKSLFEAPNMVMSLEVDGEKIEMQSKQLEFSPSHRSYHFTFANESLNELIPLEYKYRLNGVEKRWNYVSSVDKNAIVYANIEPGEYEFEVKVKSSSKNWITSTNNRINFTVTSYFYQKSWFVFLVGSIFLGLYFINDYFRSWRYEKETKKLTKLVEQKTQSLKEVQKRELQRERKSRDVLNDEIEVKSKELERQMLITLDKEKQLQETQKMEVVGQLTSGIAHDFNNMLSVIFIGSEVIRKDLEKNSTEQYENLKWLNNILLTAENCKEVIGQLLNFTRKDNDKNQTFCVYDALSDILSLIKIGIPNTIQFNMNFSTEPAFINADLSQFNQVILNLIINARNACGDYGEITITTGFTEKKNHDSCIACQQVLQETFLEIVISDTGRGIHQDLLEHIFKPFFSANSGAESTGIGLHIVNTNVHKMNGHIRVLSNDNMGMSFIVLLPLVEHQPKKSTVDTLMRVSEKNAKNILLVEDSSSLIELISLIFEENNISYDVGKNGLEGVDLFFQNPDKYDLVLTDNSMPEMNGIDMSKYILLEFPTTNIVLLTGDINDAIVKKCENIGISEIFLKPIKSDELVKLVNSYTKK